jgi:serine phosphatase RsbU (regulator of sigma subunit)
MVVGFALFLGLAAGSRLLFDQTEDRLLAQRTKEAGQALQISVGQLTAPLDAAAKLAAATDGDPTVFAKLMRPYIGAGTGTFFTSAALYRVGDTHPVAEVGPGIALPDRAADAVDAMLQRASTQPFGVIDLLSLTPRRLGYAVPDAVKVPAFVVYAERELSADPNTRNRNDEPFAQLDYAIYLGSEPSTGNLVGASLKELPISSRSASQVVPFGDKKLLLVMTPIGHLGGELFANLWWIVGLGGALVATAFAILTRRLLNRRDTALTLASDNERLYDEQRHIAETLQLGLLPQHLDAPSGVTVAARYWPAGAANLIGGDFYDSFAVGDDRWGIAIGDVCGKGIEAAALTGLARHTLRAAARNSSSPTDVLRAVHHALREHRPATFCTAAFAYVSHLEDGGFRVELSLGGHPQPLLRHSDGRVEGVGKLGMLLGMLEPTLSTTVFDVQPGDTLVLYTDGLTDAPAEKAVSVGEVVELLEADGAQPIEQLADTIRVLKRSRRPQGSDDDTALLILRFGDAPSSPARSEWASSSEPASSGGTR